MQGWTDDNGTITLVADVLKQGKAQSVLLHEMFHAGVKPLIGYAAWNKLMGNLEALYRQFENPMNKGANQFFQQAQKRVANAQNITGDRMKPHISAEEFGAYAVEEADNAPRAEQSWAADLTGRIKAWLLQRFGKQFGKVTPQQLRALALAALKAQVQQTGGKYPVTVRFSLGNGKFVTAPKEMRQVTSFNDARKAADAFAGDGKVPLVNRASGIEAFVSKTNINKMLNQKAVDKSESAVSQAMAVANLDKLFSKAIYGWSKPNDKSSDTDTATIHRMFAPMPLSDGRVMLVKMTVKESMRVGQRKVLYTVEAVELNEISAGATWVHSALQLDGQEQTNIRSPEDYINTGSVSQFSPQSNIDDVMRLAGQIEAHNGHMAGRASLDNRDGQAGSNDDRKYSIASAASSLAASFGEKGGKEITPARIKQEMGGLLTQGKSKMLASVALNYFTELARPNMTAVKGYLDVKR